MSLLSALQNWNRYVDAFNPAAKNILEILSLETLSSPETWSLLLSSGNKTLAVAWQYRTALHFAEQYLPRILTLLDNPSVTDLSNININEQEETSTFSIGIVDENDESVSPERLIKAMSGTRGLYNVCATLSRLSNTNLTPLTIPDLKIIAAGSGSDLLITMIGSPVVIGCLLKVFQDIHKVLIFFPELKTAENAKAISEKLSTLVEINLRETEGVINHEEAGTLRHELGIYTDEFVSARAYVPRAQIEGTTPVRELMTTEPKLLTGPLEEQDKQSSTSGKNTSKKKAVQKLGDKAKIAQIEHMLASLKKESDLDENTSDEDDSDESYNDVGLIDPNNSR